MMRRMVTQERLPVASPPAPANRASSARTAIVWLLLCVAVPLLLVATAVPHVALNTSELWLVLLLTAYSGTHLAVRFGRGDLRIASTTFWLFVYVAMSIATLAEVSTGLHPFLADANTLPQAVIITLVGCVAYNAAQLTRRLSPRRKGFAPKIRGIHYGRLNVIGAIGILASIYYIQTIGLSNFFSSRADLTLGISQAGLVTNGSQVVSATVESLAIVPLVLAWLGWTASLSRGAAVRRSPGGWLWYLTLSAFVVIVSNPIGNPRNLFLTVSLAALFCLPNLGQRGMRFVIAAGVVLAITVFPYSDYFRVAAASRQPLQVNSVAVELATKDYDQMTMTANGVWYAGVFGHTNGSQLLSDGLFFVPHTVWPGRATDTGVLIGKAMSDPSTNLSGPLWLEFWLDFSWLGLIVGFLAFGWVSALWDDLFIRLRRQRHASPALLDLALPLFASYQFILVRGSILSAMGRMVVMAILLLVVRGRPVTGEETQRT